MSLRSVGIRLLLYTVLSATVFQTLIAYQIGLRGKKIFHEGGAVEDIQIGLLLFTSLLLLVAGTRRTAVSLVCYLLAAFPLMAAIRELDFYFDRAFGKGAWGATIAAIMIGMLIVAWRRRQKVLHAARLLASTAAYGYLASGFLVVMVMSRLVGQQTFWKAVVPHKYTRDIPRVIEELTELGGYMLLFFGAIELLFWVRDLNRNELTTAATSPNQENTTS